MRLLNVKTLDVDEFTMDNVPQYVILSHTWATDASREVSFDTIMNASLEEKKAFPKIQQSAWVA